MRHYGGLTIDEAEAMREVLWRGSLGFPPLTADEADAMLRRVFHPVPAPPLLSPEREARGYRCPPKHVRRAPSI